MSSGPVVDDSWTAITGQWGLVVADLAQTFHLDLYDPVVLARPWPGVRLLILSLLTTPGTRLRAALTIRK